MRKTFSLFIVFILLFTPALFSQDPYKLPPKEVIDIVTAAPPPRASMSPCGEYIMLVTYKSMPSIAYMSQPLLRLAGTRITPLNNSRQQTMFYTSIIIKRIKDSAEIKVTLPAGAKLGYPRWSFDGKWIAFTRYLENGVELWVTDRATGKAKALTGPVINASVGSGFTWLPDNQHLLVHTIVENRGAPPEKPAVPIGPNIQEVSGKFAKVWTYQDLLKDPHDKKLFTYYTTSQLIKINAQTGDSQKFGKPGIYMSPDSAPDGKHVLIHKIKEPYSYSVP